MAKATALISNFTGGEISPRLDGRVDITKYKNGLRTAENFQILPHGGARKRSGTRFVVEQKSDSDDVVFVPFQYSVDQSYVLMFGPNYIWFFKDRGVITDNPVTITDITAANPPVVTASGHGFSNGDRVIITSVSGMVEVNNRQFVVANQTSTTFELSGIDGSAFTAYSSGGTVGKIIELATTYAADELDELTFAQTHDVMYIAHKSHPLRKLSRTSHTTWTLSEPSITTGPFRTINSDSSLVITPSAFSGAATGYGTHAVGQTCTLTCSGAYFTSGMVGGLFRLYEEGGGTGIQGAPVGDSTKSLTINDVYTANGNVYGVAAVSGTANWSPYTRVPEHDSGTVRVKNGANYFDSDFLHPGYSVVRVTAYTSSTVVTAEIVRYQMPEAITTSGTSYFQEGSWSDYRGYARAIAFHENRLWLAGSDSDPSVLWSSRSGSYEDFEDGADDDDAIVYRIATGQADVIRWLSAGRVLTAGTSTGEFAIAASNNNEALTPSNFKAAPQTTYGTSKCPPVRVNQIVLYPQRNGTPDNPARKMREFAYQFESDSFASTDLTVFSEHIMGDGFDRIAYQLEPDSLIWAKRTDGQLACCTYERTQEVIAWSRMVLAGTNSTIKALTVIPGAENDEVWISAQRFLGEVTYLTDEAGNTFQTEDDADLVSQDSDDLDTVRYVEVLLPSFRDTDDKDDAVILDSSLSYAGPSTTTLSGLYHLRDQSVYILNNGSVETATVSATGSVTLTRATTKAHVGLVFTAKLETEDIEAGAQAGTAQSRAKRISQVYLRLLSSLGGSLGPNASAAKPLHFRTGADVHGTSPALFSGLKEVDFNGGWESDTGGRHARIYIEHSDPLPFHITGIVAELNTTG